MPLLPLPIYIFNLPILLSLDAKYLLPELRFMALFTISPLLILFIWSYILKLKSKILYFLLTLLLVVSVGYFNFTINFVLSNFTNALRLGFLYLVFSVFVSLVLTYLQQRLFHSKQAPSLEIVRIPILLAVGILVASWVGIVVGNNLLLNLYIATGETLQTIGVNIFYADWYGFIGVFLSLVVTVTCMVMSKAREWK